MASAFPFGTGSALSNTTASFTQTAGTASTSSSTTTSSTFSFGTPSSSPYVFGGASDPLSSPALTKRGATGFASTVTTRGPVPPESTAPATPSSTIKSAVTTGLIFSPAPRKPLFSGIGEATGFTSTVTTTTPASPAPGLFSLQAASSAGSQPSITTSKQEPEPVVLKVANSKFYDFDRDKTEECFTADQIWAVYDYLDLIPRGYARINKVYSPFKVDITWLEFFARDINETAWKRSVLPVACGKFIHSATATTENICAFSHKIFWTRRVNKIYNIYPQKGETWALYKNWNIKWSSDAGNHREYEYEFVVVLSYYTKISGILVDPLVNLKGFVCLFKPAENNGMVSFQIPSNEMLRFSHRVPSYRTNGKEQKDVPEGCFELDTCSLPTNLQEVSGVIDTEDKPVDCNINGLLKSVSRENPRPKKRKNPDAESSLDESFAGGNKSSRISKRCYRTNGKKRKDVSEGCFELDTCFLPTNLEEVSGVIDTEDETVDCNVNGSLKSVSRENPVPKKRKNPDAESSLGGSSAGGNKSSRISNGCYKNSNEEKRAAEAFGPPLDKSKATDVSDGKKKCYCSHQGNESRWCEYHMWQCGRGHPLFAFFFKDF
ncbi:hypothetical protein C5167_022686 [Papaver somniferum]|uniref:DUF3444 domain-containing protein n=2 Tax=Papaver somniferum TaxID=3469 RepID=A0A4Y7JIK6_PAPSO|nr:uncharacterized protein LOC113281720 isoform X2 [Papaver somniferum]RZC60893.1 hypothetical protein C5167_022686 [Papaver somniferum]